MHPTQDRIISHFRANPREWLSIRDLADILGLSDSTARYHTYELWKAGFLESGPGNLRRGKATSDKRSSIGVAFHLT